MKFSHFFINRPIFASVLSIVIVIVGALSYFRLPVAQYPEIAPPTITVTGNYPGANADTVAQTVVTPIEQEINGVEDMLYISSISTNDGSLKVTVTFKLGTDLDKAQVLVQNRVAIAQPKLPQEVQRTGVVVQKASPDILLVAHLISPKKTYDQLYVSNYATLQVKDALARLDGVGSITMFGAREYSMRVWINPDKAAYFNLTAGEVVAALRAENVQVAAGILGQPPVPTGQAFQVVVNSQGRFFAPEQFENIVIKSDPNGRLIRLKDLARVELGAKDYVTDSFLDGEPAVAMVIAQRPGSNALETADNIIKKLDDLSASFPKDLEYRIVYNPTEFISESVNAVKHTVFDAVILVVLVVIVFLQNWRSAIIPLLAIPVSLIGTFAVMGLLGFSLNNLSLFGLVLAIGIVVDDAIVVVENVERHISLGLTPKDAAFKAMDEVGAAVLAIALVLSAVFIPTAFLGGISGQFYRQFALTIAVATIISAFNSLTLSPAMSALLLTPHGAEKDWFGKLTDRIFGRFFTWFNNAFTLASGRYSFFVTKLLKFSSIVLVLYVGLLALTGVMFKAVPGGFIPQTDQGYAIIAAQLPDGASLERTDAVIKQAEEIALKTPGVLNSVAFAGFSGATQTNQANAGAIYARFTSFEERVKAGLPANKIIAELQKRLSAINDAYIVVLPPPSVRGIGSLGGFEFVVQDKSGAGLNSLQEATDALIGASRKEPALRGTFTLFRASSPQLFADINREKAQMLNVPSSNIFDALQIYLGSSYINDFNYLGRTFRVTAQADAPFRRESENIALLRTRSAKGAMVPLGSLVTLKPVSGPEFVARYNLFPSASVNGDTGQGFSSGQSSQVMANLGRDLPRGFGFEWTGLTYQQIIAGNSGIYIFPLCVLFVFLLLAAQYESWSLPLTIILIVPMCLLCAIIGVWLRGMENNILTQIGFVVLVGLACKNAILIVEVAKEEEFAGKSIFNAAVEACRLRLRPILMTSFAFILGVVPLAIASGPGSEMRQALGTAVFSGMLGVTVFGLLLTPVFYFVIRSFTKTNPQPHVTNNEHI